MKWHFGIAHCALAAVMAALLAGDALAAKELIDLSDSQWDLDGSLNAIAKKVGGAKKSGQLAAVFGPNAQEGLADNEFKVTDMDGDSFTGTYETGTKGTVLTAYTASIEAYVEAKLEAAAAEEGLNVTVNDVEITSDSGTARPKALKMGISLTLNAKVKATVAATVEGRPFATTVTATLKGKGSNVIGLAGTQWFIPTKIRGSVRGVGGLKDDGTLEVTFGPHAGEGLAEGEVKAVDDDGRVFSGTYTAEANGKVSATINNAEVEAYIAEEIEANATNVTNVTVDVTEHTVTATVKPGVSIKATMKAKFVASGDVDGEPHTAKGSYTEKGTGTPQE